MEVSDEHAVAYLIGDVNNFDEAYSERFQSLVELRIFQHPLAIETLCEVANNWDEDWLFRREAISQLIEYGGNQSVDTLCCMIVAYVEGDAPGDICQQAINALIEFGDERAVEPIYDLLCYLAEYGFQSFDRVWDEILLDCGMNALVKIEAEPYSHFQTATLRCLKQIKHMMWINDYSSIVEKNQYIMSLERMAHSILLNGEIIWQSIRTSASCLNSDWNSSYFTIN